MEYVILYFQIGVIFGLHSAITWCGMLMDAPWWRGFGLFSKNKLAKAEVGMKEVFDLLEPLHKAVPSPIYCIILVMTVLLVFVMGTLTWPRSVYKRIRNKY